MPNSETSFVNQATITRLIWFGGKDDDQYLKARNGGSNSSLIQKQAIKPELMVLAIGSGSLMFSHINDGGFWLFKEYFNLSIGQTIRTWSLMETIVSIVGLLGVLALNLVV